MPGSASRACWRRASGSARAAGFTVLTARASDLEREFAFGVARQLFERAVQRAPQWWAGAAEQARAVFDDAPAATGGIFEDVSQSVLHGLYWLVVNASGDGPLLLSVDDLQLCDRSSLRFLSYLSRRLDGLPVVVLAGLRTAGQPAGDATLAEIVGDPTTEVVEPQPLTVDAVAEVLRRRMEADPARSVRRGLPPRHRWQPAAAGRIGARHAGRRRPAGHRVGRDDRDPRAAGGVPHRAGAAGARRLGGHRRCPGARRHR